MRCGACRKAMIADPAFDSFDEHLTLRVTVWHCPRRGQVIEEILCEPEGDSDRPRRIRYPVRQWTDRDRQVVSRSWTGHRTPVVLAA